MLTALNPDDCCSSCSISHLFVNFFAKSPTLHIVVFAKSFTFFFLGLFQAYTTELEQKVELLQEENARLKRQQKEVNTLLSHFIQFFSLFTHCIYL
jgi:hypothetical protein